MAIQKHKGNTSSSARRRASKNTTQDSKLHIPATMPKDDIPASPCRPERQARLEAGLKLASANPGPAVELAAAIVTTQEYSCLRGTFNAGDHDELAADWLLAEMFRAGELCRIPQADFEDWLPYVDAALARMELEKQRQSESLKDAHTVAELAEAAAVSTDCNRLRDAIYSRSDKDPSPYQVNEDALRDYCALFFRAGMLYVNSQSKTAALPLSSGVGFPEWFPSSDSRAFAWPFISGGSAIRRAFVETRERERSQLRHQHLAHTVSLLCDANEYWDLQEAFLAAIEDPNESEIEAATQIFAARMYTVGATARGIHEKETPRE